MDILEALASAPRRSTGRCKVQRWLSDIEPGAPGLDKLIELVENTDSKAPDYLNLEQAGQILRRLGLDVSDKTLGAHRRRTCRCFD